VATPADHATGRSKRKSSYSFRTSRLLYGRSQTISASRILPVPSKTLSSTALHSKNPNCCDERPLTRIPERASSLDARGLSPQTHRLSGSECTYLLIPKYFSCKPLRLNILPISPAHAPQVIKNEYFREKDQKRWRIGVPLSPGSSRSEPRSGGTSSKVQQNWHFLRNRSPLGVIVITAFSPFQKYPEPACGSSFIVLRAERGTSWGSPVILQIWAAWLRTFLEIQCWFTGK
jgi:hypothetical protein